MLAVNGTPRGRADRVSGRRRPNPRFGLRRRVRWRNLPARADGYLGSGRCPKRSAPHSQPGWLVCVRHRSPVFSSLPTLSGLPARMDHRQFRSRTTSASASGDRRTRRGCAGPATSTGTISTYLNATLQAGFEIEEVAEPSAGARLAQEQPIYTRVPIFFAVRARVGQ